MKIANGYAASVLALVMIPIQVLAQKMESSPAIMGNSLYIGADDGALYAYNLTTYSIKWTYATGGAIRSSPAIATDGTVYVGSYDGYVYAINPSGTRKWRFFTGASISSSPAIGTDGTVYIGSQDGSQNGYLFAINPNGTERWRFYCGAYVKVVSSPVIGSDGSVLIVDRNVPAILHAIDPVSGQQRWAVSLGYGSLTNPETSPCIAPDGTIYVAFTGGNGGIEGGMLAIWPFGSVKWGALMGNYSAFQYVHSSPSLAPDGTILFTGDADDGTRYLFALNPANGATKWKYYFPIPQNTGGATPCIDQYGYVYFNNGRVFALFPNGQEYWSTSARGANSSSPIIDRGIMYVGTASSGLESYGIGEGERPTRIWSMYRGNARHTANYADVYAPNRIPNTPNLINPISATGVSFSSLPLQASAFSDPDEGDAHAASQWQIDLRSDFTETVWDSGESAAVTQTTVPQGALIPNMTYYWRVRYKDSSGGWSSWSVAAFFTTMNGPTFRAIVDYDQDRKTDIAVYHPSSSTWYILHSGNGQTQVKQFGWNGTIPVPGDFDGDGKTDIAVYHPSSSTWYILQSGSGQTRIQQYGWNETIPVQGDFDGDGKTDIAVYYRGSSTWYILQSGSGQTRIKQFGWNGTIPVPGDFDGDGKTDIAVYYRGSSTWYILQSGNEQTRIQQYGWTGTIPVPGYYDSDGKMDIAVYYRGSSTWYIQQSANGQSRSKQYGWSATTPTLPQYQINRWFGLIP